MVLSGPVDWVPLVAFAPVQAPEAVQLVALVLDHVRVEALPAVTVVGLGVMDTVGAFGVLAAGTAAPASTIPAPQVDVVQSAPVPVGNARAEDCNSDVTCAGVNDGLTANISETTPATFGVAMLVPW